MAALISDLDEQSQICEQSLLARSKPSLARTWSQRWKRDSWTRLLSGRILKPSHGQSFVTAWTSSLEVIPASHSAQQASDSEEKIHDTSGLGSQMELFPCDPESVSSRTSRDTSASDSERSLANWRALVTRLRGEYSQRVKSAHLTNASGSSSWPTCAARDWKGCGNAVTRKDGKHRLDTLEAVVIHGLPRQSNWLTPATVQIQRADMQKRIDYRASIGRQYVPGSLEEQMQQHGQAVPDSHSTDGSRQESWATPKASDPQHAGPNMRDSAGNYALPAQAVREQLATPRAGKTTDENPETWQKRADAGQVATMLLTAQVKAWATPQTRDHRSGDPERFQNPDRSKKLNDQMPVQNGKLNPRWVETLMGLPIGWTMPSCISPLTIAQTNYACLETESCLPPLPELF